MQVALSYLTTATPCCSGSVTRRYTTLSIVLQKQIPHHEHFFESLRPLRQAKWYTSWRMVLKQPILLFCTSDSDQSVWPHLSTRDICMGTEWFLLPQIIAWKTGPDQHLDGICSTVWHVHHTNHTQSKDLFSPPRYSAVSTALKAATYTEVFLTSRIVPRPFDIDIKRTLCDRGMAGKEALFLTHSTRIEIRFYCLQCSVRDCSIKHIRGERDTSCPVPSCTSSASDKFDLVTRTCSANTISNKSLHFHTQSKSYSHPPVFWFLANTNRSSRSLQDLDTDLKPSLEVVYIIRWCRSLALLVLAPAKASKLYRQ